MKAPHHFLAAGLHKAQRGVSLLFALIALVVLTLGAVALLRAVDTGLLVLGNLGFKQDALAAGSLGTEVAITWLADNAGPTLDEDRYERGYSAVAMPGLDPTGRSVATNAANLVLVDWDDNSCDVAGLNARVPVCLPASAPISGKGGNTVRYAITRLCATRGAPTVPNDCVAPAGMLAAGQTSQRGGLNYSSPYGFAGPSSLGTYYRIVTRTEGVRGTVSYTETLVHF